MITIVVDPNSEVPPNFMLDEHKFTREAIMYDRAGMSDQRAAEILLERWNEAWEQRKTQWIEERAEREAA